MRLEKAADFELLKRSLAGDERSFTVLYRRHQGGIFRFALRMSGCESVAEDVTQEVFLTLIRSGIVFDPALGSFPAWLYGVARKQLMRRLSQDRRLEPVGDAWERAEIPDESLRSKDPLEAMTDREALESLQRAIAALPLQYREVVILCELRELTYAEAAAVVGCPEGTVRSRLHRARALLMYKLRAGANGSVTACPLQASRCLP